MIENPLMYLTIIFALGGGLWLLETHSKHKIFTWLPAIVLIYLIAVMLSQTSLFAHTAAQSDAYKLLKSWLLPMMLFLMMLRLDLHAFAALGKKLLLAYFGAVFSLSLSFMLVFTLFHFDIEAAGVFGALAGSWTGGTANMLAVAGAMHISESQLAPALLADALLYTLWVTTLLLLVPFASRFDRWSGSGTSEPKITPRSFSAGNVRTVTALLLFSLFVAFAAKTVAAISPFLPPTTWMILLATFAGGIGSFTPLRALGGSDRIASLMLYLLIALIGSHASLCALGNTPVYLVAAASILLMHAVMMIVFARIFKLSLFSIGIASLANIGGVASAPILAAAHNRRLVGAAVIMAVMGYLIGTLLGLLIAATLERLAV